MSDISKITIGTTTYDIKDAVAREAIAQLHSFEYVVSTNAATTPDGIQWTGSTTVTGTLVASASTMYKIYLVSSSNGTKDSYDEYITIRTGSSPSYVYSWEKIGNTDIDLSAYAKTANLGALAFKGSASGSFKPAGTVSKPNVTVTAPTASITPINSVGSLPSFTPTTEVVGSVSGEILTLKSAIVSAQFSAGSLPTKGTAVNAVTSISAELDSTPTFTGTSGTVTVS